MAAPKSCDGSFTETHTCPGVDRGDLERQAGTGSGLDHDKVATLDTRKAVELRRSPRVGVPRNEGAACVTRRDSTLPVAGVVDLQRAAGLGRPHERKTEPDCGDGDSSTAGRGLLAQTTRVRG